MVTAQERLTALRVYDIPGWMTEAELAWLYEQAWKWAGANWVEVGSYRGRSAAAIIAGMHWDYAGDALWCVDTFDGRDTPSGEVTTTSDGVAAFCETFRSRGLPLPRILPLASHIAARYIDAAAVVFIDAAHDAGHVQQDIDSWLPKLQSPGMLCGHDYGAAGVSQAVDRMFGERVRTGPGGIWYVEV